MQADRELFLSLNEVLERTLESDALSRDLKKRGFKFVGSTIIYAHMQAAGMVNDHIVDCFRHREISKLNEAGPGWKPHPVS